MVLECCGRCLDSHDLSAYHHLYDLCRHIRSFIKAAPGYQKSSPSYKLSSLNFDSQKLFVETLWDHLNTLGSVKSCQTCLGHKGTLIVLGSATCKCLSCMHVSRTVWKIISLTRLFGYFDLDLSWPFSLGYLLSFTLQFSKFIKASVL